MAWPPAPWERSAGQWRDDLAVEVPEPRQYPDEQPAAQPSREPRYGMLAREVLETVLLTAIIFISIRVVVQNFRIEGSSMEPTLHSGQYVLVNKLSYGSFGGPQRGDIVVFEAWNQDKDFIKRVVGVPGDTIEIHDNQVFVNGDPLPEPYLDEATRDNIEARVLAIDEYFVMGDNRGNSSDSRAYGPLDEDHIIGKAWLTYWPPDQVGLIRDGTLSFAAP